MGEKFDEARDRDKGRWISFRGFNAEIGRKLRFARAAVRGRFGKVALKPICKFISSWAGQLTAEVANSFKRWEAILPKLVPRRIVRARYDYDPGPVRFYSDATGPGGA